MILQAESTNKNNNPNVIKIYVGRLLNFTSLLLLPFDKRNDKSEITLIHYSEFVSVPSDQLTVTIESIFSVLEVEEEPKRPRRLIWPWAPAA